MKVLIIHSQVSYGFVGSNTTSLVLKLAGIETITVPTVLYSNHLGHAIYGGGVVPEDLFADVLRGIKDFGLLKEVDLIITGFFGSAKQIEIAAEFIQGIKENYPHITYLCDPVMGDVDKGQYVQEDVPDAIINSLFPLADYLTPNHFEAERILGTACRTQQDFMVQFKKRIKQQKVMVTGANVPKVLTGNMGTYLVNDDLLVQAPKIDLHPPGTGELFAAHLLISLAKKVDLMNAIILSVELVYRVMDHMKDAGRNEFELDDILFSMELRSGIE
jgi:pyridoxine kinase